MSHFQWRKFIFFDHEKDIDKGELAKIIDSDAEITAVCGGRGLLMVGDSIGRLHLFDRKMTPQTLNVFSNTSVKLITRGTKSGLVVCVSGSKADATVKVFDIDKPDKNSGLPSLVRSTPLNNSNGVPVAVAVEDDLHLVAVGFDTGTLILVRGDLRRPRFARQKNLLSSAGSSSKVSVSGLTFRSSKLYVATTTEVLLFNVAVKDKETCTRLDDSGCDVGLTVATEGIQEAFFATARKDAIYFYSHEGRGQCYAIEGEKCNMFWFRNYLVVVIKETPMYSRSSADMHKGAKEDKFILNIFDVHNKLNVYSAPIKAIKTLAAEWGFLYGITNDNKMFQLVEKDIQTKLDLLFKKNFYDIAIKIAKSNQYDTEDLVDIFRQYGDHLYNKGDNSSAIDNYIKTIGHLEPSYVIKRFLDPHKIHFLTAYLQALHKEGKANEDHTTLLLNCYTKLKDESKLDEFILKDQEQVDFDVDVAIKVCRQAGFNEHAIDLAKKHNMHERYLQIQLDDKQNFKEGLIYIGSLDFDQADYNMRKYGACLMKHLPKETTELLKSLCTNWQGEQASPDDFLPLFIRHSEEVIDFLEFLTQSRPSQCSELVYNNLLEQYLHQFKHAEEAKEDVKEIERRIMGILSSSHFSYDNDHALVLCQLHNFRRGTLHLYERKGLHSQILKLHIELNDVEAALDTCRKYGPQDPNLWIQALQLIGNVEDQKAKEEHIGEILETIEEQGLMSPLMVIRTLGGSPLANLGIVLPYLKSVCNSEQKQIDEHARVIEQYRKETDQVRQRIHKLQTQPLTLNQTKCSICDEPLELPVVHFLCGHSFHSHCLQSYGESENECPVKECSNKHQEILDIVKSQQQSREQPDAFHSQLEKSDDGFAVVADYFGRGMFRGQTFAGEANPVTVSVAEKPRPVNYVHAPTSAFGSAVASAVASAMPREEKPVAVTVR